MQQKGVDVLGAYEYQSATLSLPGECAIGSFRFWGKKGNTDELAARVMARGRSRFYRQHLTAFDYDHKYPIGDLTKTVYEGAAVYESLAKKFLNAEIAISPFCEHRHPRTKMEPIFKKLRQLAPHCTLINSPEKSLYEIPGVVLEIHLENSRDLPKEPKGPYGISFDGFGSKGNGDFTDTDVQRIVKTYKKALYILAWDFRMNGKFAHTDTRPIGVRDDYAGYNYLMSRYEMLLPREGGVTWPDDALYKPSSDDHGGSPESSKDCEALCILPERVARLEIIDTRGNKVMSVPRSSLPDHVGDPKGPRYYFGMSSYELATKLRKGTGSALMVVKAGNKKYPATDAVFRSGKFK